MIAQAEKTEQLDWYCVNYDTRVDYILKPISSPHAHACIDGVARFLKGRGAKELVAFEYQGLLNLNPDEMLSTRRKRTDLGNIAAGVTGGSLWARQLLFDKVMVNVLRDRNGAYVLQAGINNKGSLEHQTSFFEACFGMNSEQSRVQVDAEIRNFLKEHYRLGFRDSYAGKEILK